MPRTHDEEDLESVWPGQAPTGCDRSALDAVLRTKLHEARVCWPNIGTVEAAFVARLAERVRDDADPVALLTRLHVADLRLVDAVLDADHDALLAFESIFGRVFRRAARKLRQTPSELDDLRDALRVQLSTAADGGGRPRLAQYRGEGPLEGWLQVTIVRAGITHVRRDRREQAGVERLAGALPSLGSHPELELIRHQYRGAFADAFERAMASLPRRDRTLLRLRYLDDLNIDEIGRLFHVHRATAARWLATIRRRLLDATREHLKQGTGIATPDIDSVIRALRSAFPASVAKHLAPERDETTDKRPSSQGN